MRTIIAIGLIGLSMHAIADECASVIALSKVVSTIVHDKDAVEQNAANFCSEYNKSSSTSKSKSFGASYKFLAASFGSSGASAEEVASKYCSASSHYSASKDAYRQYIESISPNAYGAYQRCLEMSKQDMRFDVNTASILPDEFSMSVGFASRVGRNSDATASYSASNGVSCKWNGNETKTVTIPTGSTAILECNRRDQTKRAFVNIVRTDASGPPLTLPWQAYDKQGDPIDSLAALQSRISVLANQLEDVASQVERIDSESEVMVYQCPSGTDGWNPGGAWGFYGCQGQITTQATCVNIEYPHTQPRDCAKLGKMRFR